MKLPINEWAIAEKGYSFFTDTAWNEFMGLVKTLFNDYSVPKILFMKKELTFLYREIYTVESETKKLQLKFFIDKYIEKQIEECVDETYVCSKDELKKVSTLMTMAFKERLPVVSIIYDNRYKTDFIKGYLYNIKERKCANIDIMNLHIDNVKIYEDCLFTGRPSVYINPLETPIWNMEKTRDYITTLSDISKLDRGEMKARLLIEGKHIARLNGWREDERLSKINSNKGQMRCVFRPIEFRQNDLGYLSIDFEKRAFEVHDYRGKHLREISYLGDINTGYKSHHDIKLKR